MKQYIFFVLLPVLFAITNSSIISSSIFSNSYISACKVPGLICKTCHNLIKCVETELNEFEEVELEICTGDQTCRLGKCTSEPNANCILGQEKFECTGTGIFPDPYDCKVYHICISKEDSLSNPNDIHETVKCPENFGFDHSKAQCVTGLKFDLCPIPAPVPVCSTLGQAGPLNTYSSFYYICIRNYTTKQLMPKLYLCPHGTRYKPEGKCL